MQLQYWNTRARVRLATLDTMSDDQKNRIADDLVHKFKLWKQQREGIEQQWREVDNLMNQYDPNKTPVARMQQGYSEISDTSDGNSVGLSYLFTHREALVSQFHAKMFANDYDFFSILPLDANQEESAMALEKYLQSLFQQMNLDTELIPLVRDCVQYGTAIASYEIRRVEATRRKTVKLRSPDGQIIGETYYQTNEVLYNGPKLTPLNLYDVVLDPGNFDVQNSTLIMKKRLTPHEMMANANYQTIVWDDFKPGEGSLEGQAEDYSWQNKEIAQGNTYQTLSTIFKGRVTVYEAWGDFVDDDVLYQNYVAEVAMLPNGKQKLIRFAPNPYDISHKPFIVVRFSTETSRLYGYTPLMQLVQHQRVCNTIINQVKDANAMHNERPILLKRSAFGGRAKSEDSKPLELGKNKVWELTDLDGVRRMPDDSYTGIRNSIELLGYLEGQMQKATGDNEVMSGGELQEYTKTGYASMVQEAGAARFNLYAKTLERECIMPILRMTIQFLQQEADALEPQQFSTDGGNNTLEFRPELLFMGMDFILRAASYNATKQTEQNNMLNFFQMVLGNEMTAQFFNIPKVLKLVGQRIGIRGIENTLVPQAFQMANAPNQQPGFWDRLTSFFNPGGQLPNDQSTGQLVGNSVAPAPTQVTNPVGLSGFAGFGNAQQGGGAQQVA